jgi:hypothetical protein
VSTWWHTDRDGAAALILARRADDTVRVFLPHDFADADLVDVIADAFDSAADRVSLS